MTRCSPLLVVTALLAITACGSDQPSEPPEPPKPSGPSLQILAGNNLTDTISTAPSQGLVVQVLGKDGVAEAGVEVRFEAPPVSKMFVATVGQTGVSTVASATTDAAGRATIRVQLSTRAGPGWVAIKVPLYGLADTARFTVLPGAAVSVKLSPKDTAVTIGRSFTMRGPTVDRVGNAREDPATYEVVGDEIRLEPGNKITGVAYGLARVRVRAAIRSVAGSDSGTVVVVPA